LVVAVGAEGWIGGSDEKRNEIGWMEYSLVVKEPLMMLKKGKEVKVDGVGAEQGRDRQGETVQPPFRRAFHPEDPPNCRRILYFIFYILYL